MEMAAFPTDYDASIDNFRCCRSEQYVSQVCYKKFTARFRLFFMSQSAGSFEMNYIVLLKIQYNPELQ